MQYYENKNIKLSEFWLQGWNVEEIDIQARDGASLGAPCSGLECQKPSGSAENLASSKVGHSKIVDVSIKSICPLLSV